jgi:hypothetical protein
MSQPPVPGTERVCVDFVSTFHTRALRKIAWLRGEPSRADSISLAGGPVAGPRGARHRNGSVT